MLHYQGPLFRPPSEANSLILQATLGCSYNACAFCGMYRHKRFRVRPLDQLQVEIASVRSREGADKNIRKVFLADGDALIAKTSFLEELCGALRCAFPNLRRISCYASPQALLVRSIAEMKRLQRAGLTLYYLGIESGHDAVLERLHKGVDSEHMVTAANKANAAGVTLSTMILLGAGGRAFSVEHAKQSARVVNAVQPRFVSTLVLTPVEDTPLFEQDRSGSFDHLSEIELARELRAFLASLELRASIFRSNHASNTLALEGSLPKDKQHLLRTLDEAIAHPGQAPFVPRWMRGL